MKRYPLLRVLKFPSIPYLDACFENSMDLSTTIEISFAFPFLPARRERAFETLQRFPHFLFREGRARRGVDSALFPEISGGECERASKIPGNFLISRYFRRGINNSDSFGAVWTHWVEEILHN